MWYASTDTIKNTRHNRRTCCCTVITTFHCHCDSSVLRIYTTWLPNQNKQEKMLTWPSLTLGREGQIGWSSVRRFLQGHQRRCRGHSWLRPDKAAGSWSTERCLPSLRYFPPQCTYNLSMEHCIVTCTVSWQCENYNWKLVQTVQQHCLVWIISGHVGHATTFSWMLTIACCLVVALGLGLDLVSRW